MVHDIAERVTSFDLDDLSPYALQRLQLILLANLSVAVAGVPFCAFQEPPPGGPYRLFSGHCTAGARDAAFWNAAVMHARTQDDFHPVGNNHIGTVVIPALLAIADEIPVTGRQFLSALAVGYMVAVGMSRRFSPLTSPRGLRSTSLYCPFGATAAVARLRGANSEQIANALALTTCFAGGTTQTWIDGSDEFQLHVALAAEAGLRAVDLARAGVTGASGALDGAAGFFNAFTGERPTFGDIAADFEPSAAIGDCVIKRYPVSGICQSVVLASERMAAQLPRLDAISRVQLSMNGFELNYPGTASRGPFHSFSSKLMSAAFCCASVLHARGFDLTGFRGAPSEELVRLIDSVAVAEDPELPLLSAILTVELIDGSVLREAITNSHAEVAIEWPTVDPWAAALWAEAGRSREEYDIVRRLIADSADAPSIRLPENIC